MRALLCALVCICTATHALAAMLPAAQHPDWRNQVRPGSMFSEACGQQGMAACNDACFSPDMDAPAWCPRNLTSSGCREGLTKVAVTPGTTKQEDRLPDICLAMPKVGEDCGAASKPCCLQPKAGNPSNLVRPMCAKGLSCMLSDPVTSLPYGGTRHLAAVLQYAGSSGLLAPELMGTCSSTAAMHETDSTHGSRQAVNSVLGECGLGRLSCPQGTYCASNEDHLLGGPRCIPMPPCGNDYQACCPPYSNGKPAVSSIVDKRTAVPTCNSPDAVCMWKSRLEGFDPSTDQEAVQLLTPPGSTSLALQYPETMCVPNLAQCGGPGQPCCPHAQFAVSNSPMFFRLHVCDPGLRCNDTISIFKGGAKPVLGVCEGAAQACGGLGRRCCEHLDAAGYKWRTCRNGEPGYFCGPDNLCARCPRMTAESGLSQATLAALSMPGLGNAC